MDKRMLCVLLCVCGLLVVPAAQAGPDDPGAHFTSDLGIADGGDALVTFTYTTGSTKTLHAGEAAYLDGGLFYIFPSAPQWGLQTTVGWARASVNASNASVSFVRYPLDVIGFYNYGNNHFGLGATYHMSPTVRGGGLQNYDFDNALGLVLEYRYSFFGLRFTRINYTLSGADRNFNGDSYGAFFNFTF
ncbi:MAG TPA: hypothetical protein VGH91_02840 [Gammaproteobacteria bacterium]|jgi:hypothetical protein